MVLDRTDVRSTMASYGATARPTATEFVPCEYVRFYDTAPQETTAGARTWYVRGQNFVLAYTQLESGAEFARTDQPDEYTVFVPTATDHHSISRPVLNRRTSRRTRSPSCHLVTVASP